MIATNYANSYLPVMPSMAYSSSALVDFQANSTPLLNQWYQLISAIRTRAIQSQWVTLINPPFIPNEQYLKSIGLEDYYVRIVRFDESSDMTTQYIQNCLQNGKSAVVAVWANSHKILPDILWDNGRISCKALVFCNLDRTERAEHQLHFDF